MCLCVLKKARADQIIASMQKAGQLGHNIVVDTAGQIAVSIPVHSVGSLSYNASLTQDKKQPQEQREDKAISIGCVVVGEYLIDLTSCRLLTKSSDKTCWTQKKEKMWTKISRTFCRNFAVPAPPTSPENALGKQCQILTCFSSH